METRVKTQGCVKSHTYLKGHTLGKMKIQGDAKSQAYLRVEAEVKFPAFAKSQPYMRVQAQEYAKVTVKVECGTLAKSQ